MQLEPSKKTNKFRGEEENLKNGGPWWGMVDW